MRYARPESLDEAVAALADGDATVVGGGTMVVPDMTHGRTRPAAVVDLCRAGLGGIEADGTGWTVGAMTSYAVLERSLVPLLARVAHGITGGPQIRHRGTVGGSACYANPGSDIPAVLVALRARLLLVGAQGSREVAARDFFRDAFETLRRPDELLATMRVPAVELPFGYHKFKLAEGSWPIVTAACVAGERLRVAVGGAAAVPLLLDLDRPSVGTADPAWRDHVRHEVARALSDVGGPFDDVLAPGAYKARIAPAIVARAVADALQAYSGEESA
ncbi:FAD binding domain-containing protein [Nocardioides hwasunensis]|uniref:FAD binding domain-containing protein n=1 Tax=Nocardioides hwasunensis TaxID=397258 RepID=A0ABR8MK12_9ACTN|nr:FAD binding domain-containing protein [Nocardioides hwasunensis]MBD3915411.1 FAD binding domain-containing protein [Nocardioides hwasunensis]